MAAQPERRLHKIADTTSAVAHGFFFWCIRVVKLGAEALDVNAMMPGRFCPAFLIDLQHVACAANPSVVVGPMLATRRRDGGDRNG
jgi:hypothetical protein